MTEAPDGGLGEPELLTRPISDVFAARRQQALFRMAMGLLMIAFFWRYCSLAQMLVWGAVYSSLQLVEWVMLEPHRWQERPRRYDPRPLVLALSTAVFAFPALLWAREGGRFGVANGAYLLAGSIVNTVLLTKNCRITFIYGITPLLAMLAASAVLAGITRHDAAAAYTLLIGGSMMGVCAVKVWRDASATRRSELLAQRAIQESDRELRVAVENAEAASRAKSAFLANMSHEIRTPLNGVVAVADLLSHADLGSREREMAEIIRCSGETLQQLLSDILDLARIESGALQIETAPLHLGDLVRSVAALSRLRCAEKGIGLELDIAPELEIQVLGDSLRLRQVLTNLTSNAVKFTSHGGIDLSVQPGEGDLVRFTVRDTGTGFDPADKTRILGRFQQADSSVTRRYGGSGLGLAICCELADLMHGRLDCEGRPDEGAVFWFEIPLPRLEIPQAAAQPAIAAAPEQCLRILLADDHPTNRKVVELVLDGVADLTSVENGLAALQAFSAQSYDVVLMDMQMPVMDGLTAVRRIRREEAESGRPRTPVLMLTANAMSDQVAEAMAAGADLHLAKPFTAADLFEALHTLMAAGHSQAAA